MKGRLIPGINVAFTVDTDGDVYKNGNLIKPFSAQGYERVTVKDLNGGYKCYGVHQLVAMAFLDHVPNGHTLVVDHINDVKSDNRLSNLQLITQ